MRVQLLERELHLKRKWEIARGAAFSKRNLFVQLEHDGVTGEGEAAFPTALNDSLERVRTELEQVAAALEAGDAVPDQVDGLPLNDRAGRAAMDLALLDWQAKRAGKPLGEFLGLAAPGGPIVTSFTLGIDQPEAMAEKVADARELEVLKIKLGTGVASDRAIIEAIRAETDRPIRVDANGGWSSVDEAARMIDWLAERGVELVEQPLPMGRLDDLARLRERSALPLVADEDVQVAADIPALVEVCDGINIKLMKSGGIHEALRMIEVARGHGLKIMLGCMIESSLAIAAALHLAPLADWIDLDGHLLIDNDPYEGIGLEKGRLVLPVGPGIGVHAVDRN